MNLTKITTLILLFAITTLGLSLLSRHWRFQDQVQLAYYDLTHHNPSVHTIEDLQKILSQFDQLRYPDLDTDYLHYTKSNKSNYQALLAKLSYYRVPKKHFFQKIVGNFRIRDFICKDRYYRDCLNGQEKEVLVPWNEKIFYKTLALQQGLTELGHDPQGFVIINGHRHPQYNEKVGGAKASRHIKGEAVDIKIRDINRDGRSNQTDKAIVLELLEKRIIAAKGGIGRYPGTMTVHYDVRGKRARWDTY